MNPMRGRPEKLELVKQAYRLEDSPIYEALVFAVLVATILFSFVVLVARGWKTPATAQRTDEWTVPIEILTDWESHQESATRVLTAATEHRLEPTSAPTEQQIVQDIPPSVFEAATKGVAAQASPEVDKAVQDASASLKALKGRIAQELARAGNLDRAFLNAAGDADNVVFVLDKSGSMTGGPLDSVKRHLCLAIDDLGKNKHFGVVLFDDQFTSFNGDSFSSPGRLVSTSEVGKLKSAFESLQGGGGTDPWPALDEAIRLLNGRSVRGTKVIVVLSDGYFAGAAIYNDPPLLQFRRQVQKSKITVHIVAAPSSDLDVLTRLGDDRPELAR